MSEFVADEVGAALVLTGQAASTCLAGYSLPAAEVLEADQAITTRALDLRAAGVAGTLEELRARAYLDALLGRDSTVLSECGTWPGPAPRPVPRRAARGRPPSATWTMCPTTRAAGPANATSDRTGCDNHTDISKRRRRGWKVGLAQTSASRQVLTECLRAPAAGRAAKPDQCSL
jgi:hypothetical protein